MRKQPFPYIEKFLGWHGLPVLLTLLSFMVATIIYVITLNSRVGAIEDNRGSFDVFYQKQIDDIKNSQIRTEDKIDKLIDHFLIK